MRDTGGHTRDFYNSIIYPHKGELEKWHQKNQSFWTDLKIIFATAWVVIVTESNIVSSWFKELSKQNF